LVVLDKLGDVRLEDPEYWLLLRRLNLRLGRFLVDRSATATETGTDAAATYAEVGQCELRAMKKGKSKSASANGENARRRRRRHNAPVPR
jgi:hypothetical protein